MLNNKDIIARLTESQKVRLLTGVGGLSGKDFKIMGLGEIKVCNMKEYFRDLLPHSTALSHSWNEKLWYEVALAKAGAIANEGADLAVVPGAKIKLSPYRKETSEDPYLAARFSAAHSSAAKSLGLRTALSGYYLVESDVDWMDKEPSERVINEFVTSPYYHAMESGRADAVMTDLRSLPESYKNASRDMQSSIRDGKYLICEMANEENTVDFISRGIICLSASASALEAAMNRYKKLKAAMDRGEGVTPDQIAAEEKNHTAISEDAINRALDKVIDFMNGSGELPSVAERDLGDLAFNAAVESTVLLKNRRGILPLDKERTVVLIGSCLPKNQDGESALTKVREQLNEQGYKCIGIEDGYNVDDIQDEYVMNRAVRLADSAYATVLFLGFGEDDEKKLHRTGSLELPPNQRKLADMLIKRKKRVIGVINSGHAPDIAFTRGFEAVLLVPLGVSVAPSALASVLTGQVSPSGKLAYTLYAGSTRGFYKKELYKKKYGLKSGPFVGYRYYDTAEVNVGYPFGHGLSYSTFRYSDIAYVGGKVRFSVENTGEKAADEIAQVYVGCSSSAVIRAKKELVGFAKVKLLPHEKKRLEIPINIPTVYQSDDFKTESGKYNIFVGSSVSDIRLTLPINVNAKVLKSDGERLIDYIQSITNVTEDNFTLEANYCPMRNKSYKNIMIGLGLLATAVSLAIFNTVTDISSVFIGIVASVLAVFATIFLVADVLERSRNYADDRDKINEKNKEYFAEAEQLSGLSTSRMFNDEFDSHSDEVGFVVESDYAVDDEIDQYIDTSFKMADFAKELLNFAEERGMRFETGVIESFAMSMANSGLILLDGMKDEDFNSFVAILSDYFGTRACIDKINPDMIDGHQLLFTDDNNGDHVKRATALALESARSASEKLHVLALDEVTGGAFDNLLKPFIGYITSPKDKNEIQIFSEHGANIGYNIPKNLKIIARLADSTAVDLLPISVLRAAAYNTVSFTKCQAKQTHADYHGCNMYQLQYMLEKEAVSSDVSEQAYKKIDQLEGFVNKHSDYKIGNKLWLNLERHVGLCLSLEKNIDEAVDISVATRLLPSMTAALCEKSIPEDETLKGTIEFVFGEENAVACMKFLASLQERKVKIAEEEAKMDKKSATTSADDIPRKAADANFTEVTDTKDVLVDDESTDNSNNSEE